MLVKEKLLVGARGKGGGYKLTRRPQEYTVGEILELAEGTLATVACLQKGAESCPQRRAHQPASHRRYRCCRNRHHHFSILRYEKEKDQLNS